MSAVAIEAKRKGALLIKLLAIYPYFSGAKWQNKCTKKSLFWTTHPPILQGVLKNASKTFPFHMFLVVEPVFTLVCGS